ncbi:hypothetical protein Pan216_20550 [Planctomycetes bacterium Pan216]|uniref:Uncharacterized protein n=1 Tax=Kolteria novifilia TaxID=2527975 RepID=A0A518B2I2_9BACT|nr:hypothetical protein Pan216_20550 [Planctomycetes bacterium Pan216]
MWQARNHSPRMTRVFFACSRKREHDPSREWRPRPWDWRATSALVHLSLEVRLALCQPVKMSYVTGNPK